MSDELILTTETYTAPPEFEIETEVVPIKHLKPHPLNYLLHPDEELDEIIASIKEHGLYRPVVIARDSTILAGHGVTQALIRMGATMVTVKRKDYEPLDPRARKLLMGDNEIGRMAERQERRFVDLVKGVKAEVNDLSGTGMDLMKLANLEHVVRTPKEMQDLKAAGEWVSMPEYGEGTGELVVVVRFESEANRLAFGERLGIDMTTVGTERGMKGSLWWPPKAERDIKSLKFTEGGDAPGPDARATGVAAEGPLSAPSEAARPLTMDEKVAPTETPPNLDDDFEVEVDDETRAALAAMDEEPF